MQRLVGGETQLEDKIERGRRGGRRNKMEMFM